MASIGTLAIDIAANLKPLTASLDKAQAMLTGFAGAAAAAGAVAIKQFVDTGSALKDMSDRTGVSAEALSTLKFAAEQSDTSLEALQSGLTKMARFMEAAGTGAKTATSTIASLGLKLSDLQAMAPDEKFRAFATAIASVEEPGKRAALAIQVFGKGAADLLPLLAQGGNGIALLQQEAKDLGLVMTDSAAASAEAFGDTLAKLTSAIKMVVVHVGGMFVPALSALVETLAYAVSHNKTLAGTISVLVGVLGGLVIVWKAVTIAQQAYAKAAVIAQALSGPKGWAILAAGIAAAALATQQLTATFNEMNAELEKATPNQAEMVTGLDQMTDAIENGAVAAVGKLKKAFDPFTESGYVDAFRNVYNEIRILRGVATEAGIELERMAALGVPPDFLARLHQLWKIRDALKKQQEDAAEAARQQEAAERSAQREHERWLASARPGGGNKLVIDRSGQTSQQSRAAEEQLGAVQSGSADAYKLIAQITGNQDKPVVNAIEQQTKEVVKGLNQVAAGMMGIGLGVVVQEFTP